MKAKPAPGYRERGQRRHIVANFFNSSYSAGSAWDKNNISSCFVKHLWVYWLCIVVADLLVFNDYPAPNTVWKCVGPEAASILQPVCFNLGQVYYPLYEKATRSNPLLKGIAASFGGSAARHILRDSSSCKGNGDGNAGGQVLYQTALRHSRIANERARLHLLCCWE